MNNFFSGVAVLASFLALIGSGFSVIQVLSWQQKLDNAIAEMQTLVNNSNSTINSTQTPQPTAPNSSIPSISAPSSTNTTVQPSQFIRNAYSGLATVELLKVNRVPQQPGKVNVQMRIRLTPKAANEPGLITKSIYFASATARDPNTGDTYSAQADKATPGANLKLMTINQQPSADAYVWLNIPDDVNQIDLYIPNTEAFTGVPIANN